MTMAPSHKKKGFWLELFFVGLLLFLLMGARSQTNRTAEGANAFPGMGGSRTLLNTPISLK